ncbi:MAG: hypothetical protein OFPII_31190 [Osedax symbiont Rs1]|nr:MAG: hypothetical protein OFPII_31190 [Osedax symbiont Rs1]
MSMFSQFLTPYYRAQLSYPLGKLYKALIISMQANYLM